MPHHLEQLQRLIGAHEWVVGAVNYDEDLHFSTFYLRASCAPYIGELYPGYSCLVSFYRDFSEQYFLLKNECISAAAAIVGRALGDPTWLPAIIKEVKRQSDLLGTIFDPNLSSGMLTCQSVSEIVSLYTSHAERNRSLYKYARLPEALDRGVSYFSTYLRKYLRSRGLAPNEAENAFRILTEPEEPSILAQELLEFDAILESVRKDPDRVARLLAAPKRARLLLSPYTLSLLRAYSDKWRFLEYHGYGRRTPATDQQYVDRLVEQIRAPAVFDAVGVRERLNRNRELRQQLFRQLNMDVEHRALFEIYPQIGAVKLYRRVQQLRNFYFLDMLMGEIATRLGVDEWTVRCMLPEEVLDYLRSGQAVPLEVCNRAQGCTYAFIEGREWVSTDPEVLSLQSPFQSKTCVLSDRSSLRGTVVCRGHAIGACKIVIRPGREQKLFKQGDILVSEATDPDLLKHISMAGAVLTEQGGVTSHAAIICRELGIPAITGIEGLLDRLKDGEIVEVDAIEGSVKAVRVETVPQEGLLHDDPLKCPEEMIGAKAHNLGLVRKLGYEVPPYVLVDFDALDKLVQTGSHGDLTHLVAWISYRLSLGPEDSVVVRSSSTTEDREEGSQAGEFDSFLRVGRDHIFRALCEFLNRNRIGRRGTQYHGSVIVQRMLEPNYAGVCLTKDDRVAASEVLVIEMLAGSNEEVTGGTAIPTRIIVDRTTGDVVCCENATRQPTESTLDVGDLMRSFLKIEAEFRKPVDIEWGLRDGTLYILQVRPIVRRAIGA